VPRLKLFVSARKLQKLRPQSYKFVQGLSPAENSSSSSETKQVEGQNKQKSLFQQEYYINLSHTAETVQSLSLGECVGFRDIFVVSDTY
jgi:hypothetical protein